MVPGSRFGQRFELGNDRVDRWFEQVAHAGDRARKIAEALGIKLELQQITGANRIPYRVTDRLDIVIAAMGATPLRALQISLTSPYAALSIGVFEPDSIAVSIHGSSQGVASSTGAFAL